jgi:hypothetical protein
MTGAMPAILSSLTKFPSLDFGQVTGFWNLLQVWHRFQTMPGRFRATEA